MGQPQIEREGAGQPIDSTENKGHKPSIPKRQQNMSGRFENEELHEQVTVSCRGNTRRCCKSIIAKPFKQTVLQHKFK